MAKLVSKTYGDALFELAVEENRIDSLTEEIEAVKAILDENKDFEKIMVHPEIPQEQKLSVIDAGFQGTGFRRPHRFFENCGSKGKIQRITRYFCILYCKGEGIQEDRNCGGNVCGSA